MSLCLILLSQATGFVCQPGRFRQISRTRARPECVECNIGYFSTQQDARSCQQCPPKETTLRLGSTSCLFVSAHSCEELGWGAGGGSNKVCGMSDVRRWVCQDNDVVCWTKHEAKGLFRPLKRCKPEATFSEAQTFCEEAGARLCSLKELKRNEVKDTGCGYNQNRIWSSEACPGQEGQTTGVAAHMSAGAEWFATLSPSPSPTRIPTYKRNYPTLQPTPAPTWNPTTLSEISDTNRPTKQPTPRPTVRPTSYPSKFPTAYPTELAYSYAEPNCTNDNAKYPVRCCADAYTKAEARETELENEKKEEENLTFRVAVISSIAFGIILLLACIAHHIERSYRSKDNNDAMELVHHMHSVREELDSAKKKVSSAMHKLALSKAGKKNKIGPGVKVVPKKPKQPLAPGLIRSESRSVFRKPSVTSGTLPPLGKEKAFVGATTTSPTPGRVPHWRKDREDKVANGVGTFVEGDKVKVNYRHKGKFYPGKIVLMADDGTCEIKYDDGAIETAVTGDQIRAADIIPGEDPTATARVVRRNPRFAGSYLPKFAKGQEIKANYNELGKIFTCNIMRVVNDGRNGMQPTYDIQYKDGVREFAVKESLIWAVKQALPVTLIGTAHSQVDAEFAETLEKEFEWGGYKLASVKNLDVEN